MGRPMNHDLQGDPEYTEFTEYIEKSNKSKSTAKSYRTTFRKLRDILGKNISDTAEDTCAKAIMVATDNINSAQALINIAILVRQNKQMPVDTLTSQRTTNKGEVTEMLKQANLFTDLPPLSALDDHLEDLWNKSMYRDYIVNFLIRHHYVRNQDCIFDIVDTKRETLDNPNLNYLWLDRKKQMVHYIRNNYKTARTYGQKVTKIDNERFITAVKKCHRQMYCFPLTTNEDQIGYYIQKMTLKNPADPEGKGLGEGACLKIIINHYKNDITRLKEISKSRGSSGTSL